MRWGLFKHTFGCSAGTSLVRHHVPGEHAEGQRDLAAAAIRAGREAHAHARLRNGRQGGVHHHPGLLAALLRLRYELRGGCEGGRVEGAR